MGRQGCHDDFVSRFTWLPPSYVLVVSTTHLVVRWLRGVARISSTCWTPQEPHKPSEGSSMTHSTRVPLRNTRGVSSILLTNPPPEHRTIFSHASTESGHQAHEQIHILTTRSINHSSNSGRLGISNIFICHA